MKTSQMKNNIPKHFLEFFDEIGFEQIKLKEEFEQYKVKRKTEDWKDFIWFKLQEANYKQALNAQDDEKFHENQNQLLSEMLYLRRKFQNQKANELHTIFLQNRVEYMDFTKLKMKFGIVPDARCSYSMKYKDQWFSKKKILAEISLIENNCNHNKWCTCAAICEPQRNNGGDLIRK